MQNKLNESIKLKEEQEAKLEEFHKIKDIDNILNYQAELKKTEAMIRFFNKQIDVVTHDQFILNKSKYDLIRYRRIY